MKSKFADDIILGGRALFDENIVILQWDMVIKSLGENLANGV